ncbi:glycoside hydrolase family 88/105 protein [Paenibacillus rigui]|nr:glycoside hydrolase family 88 protein [Paenibacillus rigui]
MMQQSNQEVTVTNTAELLEKVFQRLVSANKDNANDHMDFDVWEWPLGVALYGLFKYTRFTGKQEYTDFLIDWYDRHLAEGLPPKNVNSVAPLLALIHLYEQTKNEAYLNVCSEWAEWVMYDMPRTEEGGLQHITIIEDNVEQLWDDTLFMTVLFLAKMGKVTGKQEYVDEAVYQFLLHIKYLHDPETGLWFHGWSFIGRHHFGRTLWARGNCWFTAGVVEFLEIAELEGPVKRYLLEALEAQARTLAKLQESDGMWHTILTDPSSYTETSATAGFGYGILKAVRQGYLDASYAATAEKAVQAVIANIDEDGTVLQVSYGTAIGMNDEHYLNIPICPTAYGQALAIMLLTETLASK